MSISYKSAKPVPVFERWCSSLRHNRVRIQAFIFSSDFLSRKKESNNLIKDIENNNIDILVGTQMISKGFNFPKLNCIVVVDADFSGNGFDLRTTEKNIQLYTQLSGRAGRFSRDSTIIYQTITPTHKTLDDLINNKPESFLENELALRKAVSYTHLTLPTTHDV